ncbi:hypothetical protein GobsT_16600 [Gemmata obscuriglobus]|nr:hypothetical protein GobsT_16600 [Gemmata obscuriglobus]VTS03027.1 unnamed protein product [Gemmata obscuriglobus UQM 2246]
MTDPIEPNEPQMSQAEVPAPPVWGRELQLFPTWKVEQLDLIPDPVRDVSFPDSV